jgi:hypothetical protein
MFDAVTEAIWRTIGIVVSWSMGKRRVQGQIAAHRLGSFPPVLYW